MRSLLTLLLALLAPALWADFSAELSGSVRSSAQNESFANVKVSLAIDPLRGQYDYRALANLEKRSGPLAEISVTGSTTTDADGNFKLTAEFKKVTEGNYVTTKRGRPQPANVVHVFVNIEKDGYLLNIHTVAVTEGDAINVGNVYPLPIPEIKGKLLHLANRKPAADVEIQLAREITPGMQQPRREVTVKTNAKGEFRFYDAHGPHGQVRLFVLDPGLAFAMTSSGRRPFSTSTTKPVDLGNLMVVPGGGVKFKCIDAETSKPINITGKLYVSGSYQEVASDFVTDGTFDFAGLPEGTYTLKLEPGSYLRVPDREVVIVGGQTLDLGEILFTPTKTQKFTVTKEDGTKVENGDVYADFIGESDVAPTQSNGMRAHGRIAGGTAWLGGIFTGRWFVTFKSRGLASAWIEIDLPAETEPVIVLTAGGKISLTMPKNDQGYQATMDWLAVAIAGSPAAQFLTEHNRQHQPKFDNNLLNRPSGLIHEDLYAGEKYESEPLATGKYLLKGYSFATGLFSREVDVVNGRTTSLEITPSTTQLDILVTMKGQPAAGAKLYFHPGSAYDMDRNPPEVQELKCDGKGRAALTAKTTIRGLLLLQLEHEWVMGTPQYKRGEAYRALTVRQVELVHGATTEIVLRADGDEFCFLTIDAKLPKGAALQSGTLVPLVQVIAENREMPSGNRGNEAYNPMALGVDGKLTFGMLRPGRYVLRAAITLSDGSTNMLQEVLVEPKGEQKLTLNPKLNKVTVQVKAPSGVDEERMFALIAPADPALASLGFHVASRRDKDDFVFDYIPSGEYYVSVTASTPTGSLKGGEVVSVSKNSKVKVTLTDKIGSIRVSTGGARSGLLPRGMTECIRIRIYDDEGKEVEALDPREVFFRARADLTVNGLAPGTYTVKVQAHGMAEWTQKDVVVEEGGVASVGAMLESSAIARLTLEGVPVSSLCDIALTFKDASGAEVSPDAPDERFVLVEAPQHGPPVMHITNLRSEMKTLTLKVKGYKPVTVSINTDQGPALTFAPKLEKE